MTVLVTKPTARPVPAVEERVSPRRGRDHGRTNDPALVRRMILLGVVVAAWCAVAAPARATVGARTTADEPQYLLSAISLAEDGDLDIADELADERYRPFHELKLPVQTEPLSDGRHMSPHDPLLPALLAGPVAVGGWLGAKLALAALAGTLAAATLWTAVRRFSVSLGTATLVVGLFSLAAPLATYGTQVYPELPAALAVVVAVAALTGRLERRGLLVLGVSLVVLPWLAVKYAPVAGALFAIAIWKLHRRDELRRAVGFALALGAAGVAFLVAHRALYGGWTVYAAGDHFVSGEASVMGTDPNYLGRSRRLVGLVADRDFGLAAWAPLYLFAVPALAALARRRPPGSAAIGLPLAAGWLTATFVALTMHGWWTPGRQVVVVLPLAVIAVAWWVDALRSARPAIVPAVWVAGAFGVVSWLWLVVEVLTEQRTLVIDFAETSFPLSQAWRTLLPDLRDLTGASAVLFGMWIALFVALAAWGGRASAPREASGAVAAHPTDISTSPMEEKT